MPQSQISSTVDGMVISVKVSQEENAEHQFFEVPCGDQHLSRTCNAANEENPISSTVDGMVISVKVSQE